MIIKAFDKERADILVSRGVPRQELIPRKCNIDLDTAFVKMTPVIPRTSQRVISSVKQERVFETIIEHPLRNSYTMGIGSFPSDLRAKYVAQLIMNAAVDAHKLHRRNGRNLPLWHRVYGGLTDSLRDKPINDIPSMLIIANVDCTNSSNYKLEKVRDLLEKFSDIPRIVVSGGEPPCDLFANRLHYPCQYTLYIGPSNMVHEL